MFMADDVDVDVAVSDAEVGSDHVTVVVFVPSQDLLLATGKLLPLHVFLTSS